MADDFELEPPPYSSVIDGLVWRNWFNRVYEKLRGPLWEDNLTSLLVARPGATSPTLTAFGPTGTNQEWVFGTGDFVYTAGFHIQHDVKPGSLAYLHVHWTTDGTDTNTVKWEMSYTMAKGHNQEAFPADTVVTVEQAGSGTAWQHMIAEVTEANAFTVPEVDSLVICRLRRITNGGTDNADDVFGLFIDFHYQKDRFGTPQKAPNFYAR